VINIKKSDKKKIENAKIKSIAKSLYIIELLGDNESLSLKEISEDMNMAKSTISSILSVLDEFGYITQLSHNKKYSLSTKLFELGSVVRRKMDVHTIAMPFLDDLVSEVHKTVHLAVMDNNKVLYIDKREPIKPFRIVSRIGAHLPPHCSAVGKMLLAESSEQQVDYIINEEGLKKYTDNTITDPNSLKKELENIREQGYAIDNGEIMKNSRSIAAPIKNSRGNTIAALGITGLVDEMQKCDFIKAKEVLLRDARAISKKMGFRKR